MTALMRAALLVALAVDLLGARQQRLDLAEVDEHVVAVAGLLDDPGHDLGHAVDVLVVHHLALGLADPLQDHLLRGLRGDPAEVVRGDVLALDLVLGNLGPVDVEVLVVDQRVRALAVLGLERFELRERALARLFDQALLDVGGQLDRVDAEVALVVELDRRVARGARGLLVGGEERVLERADQSVAVDPLLLLDDANRFDDLSASSRSLLRSGFLARSSRTGSRPGRPCRGRRGAVCSPTPTSWPRTRLRSARSNGARSAADDALEVRTTPQRGLRCRETRRRSRTRSDSREGSR